MFMRPTVLLVDSELDSPFQKFIHTAIEDYRELIPGGKFVLIVDEADDMFRTIDRRQVFEKAFKDLRALNPSMASIHLFIFGSIIHRILIPMRWTLSDCDGFCHSNFIYD